jgi:hypothetical protein
MHANLKAAPACARRRHSRRSARSEGVNALRLSSSSSRTWRAGSRGCRSSFPPLRRLSSRRLQRRLPILARSSKSSLSAATRYHWDVVGAIVHRLGLRSVTARSAGNNITYYPTSCFTKSSVTRSRASTIRRCEKMPIPTMPGRKAGWIV